MSLSRERSDKGWRERGQTMTEYALILATIAAVLVALYQNAGAIVETLVDKVGPLL